MLPILERPLRESGYNLPVDSRSKRRKALSRDRFGKRFFRTLVGIGLVLILAVVGLYFLAQSMSYQSTDDAFIEGHVTGVAPKIAGRIDKVFIDDNQLVKKGDPIAEIDPRDYDAQLRQKQAALESTSANAVAAQAAVDQQVAKVKSLQATVDQDKADQESSQAQADQDVDDLRREQDLYSRHVVSIQDFIHSQAANRAAQANLDSARMKVRSAEAQLLEGQAQVRTFQALVQDVLAQEQENEANVEAAQLNDSYTKVFAPESGSGHSQGSRTGRLCPGRSKPGCASS